MRRKIAIGLVLAVAGVGNATAQATGTTTFNAPYRAFTRSEVGALLSFPNGGGTAFEGVYRMASGKFDIGFKGGIFNPSGPGKSVALLGVEARERVISKTPDFPLDGALVFGVGANLVSGSSVLIIPVGLSLGGRVTPQGSQVSFVPYVQPTAFFLADGGSDLQFALGLGFDLRLSRSFDARISAGLGDVEGVSIGAVWVH
jgi:hypothetical protein